MNEITKMTVFYYKDNGDIYSIISQETDFRAFNRQSEASKMIMDYVILDYDFNVIMNPKLFIIDENKKLKLVGELSKYQ